MRIVLSSFKPPILGRKGKSHSGAFDFLREVGLLTFLFLFSFSFFFFLDKLVEFEREMREEQFHFCRKKISKFSD